MKFLVILFIFSAVSAENLKRVYLKADASSENCGKGFYYKEEGNVKMCIACSDNCDGECQKTIGCPKCKDQFFKDGDGGCDACTAGCKTCDNANLCQEDQCLSTHYYMEGKCYENPKECQRTEKNKGCVECKSGFFLTNMTNGNCTTCGVGCAEGHCDPKTTNGCQKLKDGNMYYLEGGAGLKCDDQCDFCYDSTRPTSENVAPGTKNGCQRCKAGYFWYVSGSGDLKFCQECDAQCKTCSLYPYNCDECRDGFERYSAYTNANGTVVHSCRYHNNTGSNSPCETKDGVKCTKCRDGFHFDSKKFCVPDHPLNTNDGMKKHFAQQDGTLVLKSENCLAYNGTNHCISCGHLTYLKDGFCHRCHEQCIDCNNSTGICNHCQPDYYSNGTSVCYPDTSNDNEALWEIGTNTHPIRCFEEDYVDSMNNTRGCRSCSQYCLVELVITENEKNKNGDNTDESEAFENYEEVSYCDTAVGCLRCKDGFYPTPNGECSSCSPHCALCDSTLGCLHCLGDTHIKEGRCEFNGASSVLTLLIVLVLAFAI